MAGGVTGSSGAGGGGFLHSYQFALLPSPLSLSDSDISQGLTSSYDIGKTVKQIKQTDHLILIFAKKNALLKTFPVILVYKFQLQSTKKLLKKKKKRKKA